MLPIPNLQTSGSLQNKRPLLTSSNPSNINKQSVFNSNTIHVKHDTRLLLNSHKQTLSGIMVGGF